MAKQTLQNKTGADLGQFMKPVAEPVVKKRTARRAPTPKQMKAARLITENVRKAKPDPIGKVLKEAGYSDTVAEQPSRIVKSDSFQDLLEEYLPDDLLAETHKRLLTTRKIEHMVFPLMTDEAEESLLNEGETLNVTEGATLTDYDISMMLEEVGCKVKKIMHSETARHVWYWAHDANAQTKALELSYKLKGHLGKDGAGEGTGKILALFGNNTVNFVKKADDNGQ